MTGTIFATLTKYLEIGNLIANATPSAKNTPKTPKSVTSAKSSKTNKSESMEPKTKNVHYSTL